MKKSLFAGQGRERGIDTSALARNQERDAKGLQADAGEAPDRAIAPATVVRAVYLSQLRKGMPKSATSSSALPEEEVALKDLVGFLRRALGS